MSIPAALRLVGDIPAPHKYLSADAARIERWREPIQRLPGFKIGVHWQGNPAYPMDRYRSIPLAEFAPLARLPNVTLVSLQQGFGVEQIADVRQLFTVQTLGDDFDRDGAFVDTAAVLAHLDLLVTSDTALAHVAGALGIRTFVPLPAAADWRWGTTDEDCKWYPSLRLFRQTTLGEWRPVFQRLAAEISKLTTPSPSP